MKLLKFFAFIALTFILLFSTSLSCSDTPLRDDSVEIIIKPETGTIATEFHFSVKTGSDCPYGPDYWSIKDENQNKIDLGDDAYKTELSKRFESPGQYEVSFLTGRADNSCNGDKLFTIEDNGCDNYVIDSTTWLIPEIDLSPHRGYFGIQNDSVSYGFIQPTIENICALEHIQVIIGYTLKETAVNYVRIEADVTYQILYEIPFNNFQYMGDDIYQQHESIGLYHIYGNDPGWFFVWFNIKFKNRGSDATNDMWLRTNFQKLVFGYEYWTYNSDPS